MKHLKVRKIGNSLGVVLPKDVLEQLGMNEGDNIVLTKAENGFKISHEDDKFTKTMELTEKFMKKYRNTLRELSK